eukprot:5644864-Ditylum_brightwellii.AAC.1
MPDVDTATITEMLSEHTCILRTGQSYFERESVKRPATEFDLHMKVVHWRSLFCKSLTGEKSKPPPPANRQYCRFL